MTLEDLERQRQATARAGRLDRNRTRILVPPTLAIESVSPGHERHDEWTKRKWYAELGIPNYWILNGYTRSLKCLMLDGSGYRIDVEGRDTDELRPALFPGLTISLGRLWLK
jgi:Uma2 family endonuclease